MKKILLLVSLVFACFAANAQGWYIGPQASFNLAKMSNAEKGKIKTGWGIGAFGGYEFNSLIGIEAQIDYSSEGVKGTNPDGQDVTVKTSYINVPILAKFSVWDNIFFLVGPQFGFNVGAKTKVGSGSFVSDKDAMKGMDFGFLAGAGYQFDFGLRAGISYSFGVSDAIKDVSSKNRVFAITVGWRF